MKRNRFIFYFILPCLLGTTIENDASFAQQIRPVCAEALQSVGGLYGYGPRESGRLCEGIYESHVFGARLELVSLRLLP